MKIELDLEVLNMNIELELEALIKKKTMHNLVFL